MKTLIVKFTGFLSLVVFAVLAVDGAPTKQRAAKPVIGKVYDLDYLGGQGWTQVLVQPSGSSTNLVLTTKNNLVQFVLQSAVLNSLAVSITHEANDPKRIISVVLAATQACGDNGCVEKVTCSEPDGTCTASVKDHGPARTRNVRALGILLTALSKKTKTEYLSLDKDGFITRVKINLP